MVGDPPAGPGAGHEVPMTTNEQSCTTCAACDGCDSIDAETEDERAADAAVDDGGEGRV